MTVEHKDITDPYLHEPKGAAAASADTVYVANGSGSGAWSQIASNQINLSDLETTLQSAIDSATTLTVTGNLYLTATLADVSTASSVLVAVPDNCTVKSARFVLANAITTANATMNIKNAAAATMGSDVTITYSGSAKGTGFTWTATGNNVLTGPTWIEVTTDGASDTVCPVAVTIVVEKQLNTVQS